MSRKLRILHVGEASYLNTGYSNYAREVLARLHATGKYEVAELACYGREDDPRRHELPWSYFANEPPKADWEKLGYNPDSIHQFGSWRFNDVLLEFRADIVFTIRDEWMDAYQATSPFRRMFYHCMMPTVDSTPQNEQWLATFMQADALLTYTDWGRGVLEVEGGGLIRTRGTAPPAADTAVFRPLDRAAIRKKFNFEGDTFIVGTIMRNQARKLYPQLIADFARFLRCSPPDISKKTYLYIHTSYPDREGWDMPYLIKHSGISHKILLTYRCLNCHTVFSSFFQDARASCVKCGKNAATTPNVSNGVDKTSLACIMNLFDVYVQYASNEGFGMPMVEAAACGVPVMAVDYSAMSDVVRKLGGFPITVSHHEPQPITNCLWARPDGNSLAYLLNLYFSLTDEQRAWMRADAARAAREHYDWNRTTAAWMDVFDPLPPRPESETWLSPARLHSPLLPSRQFSSNEEFVEWGIRNILGRPEMLGSYMALRMIRDLNWGSTTRNTPGAGGGYHNEDAAVGNLRGVRPFGAEEAVQELLGMCEYINIWESKRAKLCGGVR